MRPHVGVQTFGGVLRMTSAGLHCNLEFVNLRIEHWKQFWLANETVAWDASLWGHSLRREPARKAVLGMGTEVSESICRKEFPSTLCGSYFRSLGGNWSTCVPEGLPNNFFPFHFFRTRLSWCGNPPAIPPTFHNPPKPLRVCLTRRPIQHIQLKLIWCPLS